MLHVLSAVSGEPIVDVNVEEIGNKSVRRLKEHLAAELGVSRFRLQLFDDNGPVEETAVIDSRHQDLQLLILAFCPKEDSRLIHAVQRNHWRRLEDLLRMPQDPDVTDRSGRTPLYHAALQGAKEAVSLLLDARADTEIQDPGTDETALHVACWKGHLEVVRLLVRGRADTTKKHTQSGNTPLQFAEINGYQDIAQVLLEAENGLCQNKASESEGSSCSAVRRACSEAPILSNRRDTAALLALLRGGWGIPPPPNRPPPDRPPPGPPLPKRPPPPPP